jgi:hypothetical protein
MSDVTAASEFKTAFYESIRDLMKHDPETPHVMVSFGAPASLEPDDLIAFTDIASEQNVATLGHRSREEMLTLTVQISCQRGGGGDMEKVVSDRAYELLGMIERYARVTDTTIGGTVRHCFMTAHTSTGETDPEFLAQGRVMEITATFQAFARIT